MMRRRAWSVTLTAVTVSLWLLADDAIGRAAATAVIAGRVETSDPEPRPIRRARIALKGERPDQGQAATSDDLGRFVFGGVSSGRYSLRAVKPPYVSVVFGSTGFDRLGTPITVGDGEVVLDLVLRMTLGAAIEGRVVDQNGEPFVGASVTAMRFGYGAEVGDLILRPMDEVVTDDRGVYRSFGLPGGVFVVVVRPPVARYGVVAETRKLTTADIDQLLLGRRVPNTEGEVPGSPVAWAPFYYPGTPDPAAAEKLALKPGEDRVGVDLSVYPLRTGRVFGVVTTPPGVPSETVEMTIAPADRWLARSSLGLTRRGRPSSDGRYSFPGVTPGAYIVRARSGRGGGGRAGAQNREAAILWASATVIMHGQDVDLPLTMQPAVRVAGSLDLRVSSPTTPSELARIMIVLHSVDDGTPGYQPAAQVSEDGTFSIDGAVPGMFRVAFTNRGGRNLFLTSATVAGREVLDDLVEVSAPVDSMKVVLTDRPSEVAGVLQDSTGKAATEYFIVVFSIDKEYWTPHSRRVAQVRPGNDGSYIIRNLPAGEYYVSALTDLAPGETGDPAFLGRLTEMAVRVRVFDGVRTLQSFRIGGVGGE